MTSSLDGQVQPDLTPQPHGITPSKGTHQTAEPICRRVEAHGLGIHMTEWHGSLPPIVMLHALGFTGRIFDPLARRLAPGFRIICPDLRGHGRTDRPPEGYQYPNLVKDLVGLLQMLRLPKLILLGHTWGADLALSFAGAHPGRLAGLVLIDGGYRHRSQPSALATACTEPTRPAPAYSCIKEAIADMKNQLKVPWSDALESAVRDSIESEEPHRIRYRLDDHRWHQIDKALRAYDPSALLESVKIPTLIVHPDGGRHSSLELSVGSFQARAAALLMANAIARPVAIADNLNLLAHISLPAMIQRFIEEQCSPT